MKTRCLGRKLAGLFPEYSVVALALVGLSNTLAYNGSRLIAGGWHHYNIESPLDSMIPFCPQSAFIYLGCYLFWFVNYCMISRRSKKDMCQFFAADLIARGCCLVFFLLFPTTNVRPYVDDSGFWNQVMWKIYSLDAADNLFPSIHCLNSWFSYIGIRGRSDIPVWYQRVSCVLALLVCVSTLTTKQHVIPDVIGGILLAEISLWIGKRAAVAGAYEKLLDKICGKIFRKEVLDE